MLMNKSADYRLLCLKTTNKCVVSVDLGESIMNSILLASALLRRKGLFGKLARAFISPRNLPVHIYLRSCCSNKSTPPSHTHAPAPIIEGMSAPFILYYVVRFIDFDLGM